jgi:DNA polymerase I-like protein with 3'-5' exonuclease and polymerase domains
MMPTSDWRPPGSFPEISGAKWWSIDIEANDPNLRSRGPGFVRKTAFVCGVSISTDEFCGYFPTRHAQGANLAPNVVFEWLRDQAKHFRGELYGANLLYDLEGLWFEDVRFSDDVKIRDVQILEPLIDENSETGYSLDVLAKKYVGTGKDESLLREMAQSYSKGFKDRGCKRPISLDPKADLWMLPPEYVGPYAEADARLPRLIYEKQIKIIEEEGLQNILELESSLVPILLRMRINGIKVDLEAAERLRIILTKEIGKYSAEIKKLLGFEPNVDSSQDMAKAYNIANFKFPEFNIAASLRLTAHGNPSFTADFYSSQKDPLSRLILRKKKLSTLRDDFVLGDIVAENIRGRIHCQYHQLRGNDEGTRTGRFSSTRINMQQVPKRQDDSLWDKGSPNWAEEVRKLFVADKGKQLAVSDYSQQEPRLLVHFAYLCRCPGAAEAVEAFRKNPLTDYHQLTTDIVNKVSGKNFKRKQIKSVNLGISYSAGVAKVCAMLGVSVTEGQEILSAYHHALPFVRALSTKAMSTAQERGYITTLLGRRCRFPSYEPIASLKEERGIRYKGLPREQAEQQWPGRRLQKAGTHKSLNRLVQGSAADQCKKAIQVLYYQYGILPQILVHDEVATSVIDISEARTLKLVMETCVTLELPVVADCGMGPSWGDAKEKVCLN